jgi:hypothetical protein
MQRRSIVFGSLVGVGLLAIAWQEYYRSSPLPAIVGIAGPRANSGRRCDDIYSHRKFWQLPLRPLMCRGPSVSSARGMHFEGVGVDALTRKIFSAQKSWTVPDSAQWMTARDSLTRAMVVAGGHRIRCEYEPLLPPPGSVSYWKVADSYVRILTVPPLEDGRRLWNLSINGQASIPYECVHPPRDREEKCTGADVIRIPLPRGWVACWRNPLID